MYRLLLVVLVMTGGVATQTVFNALQELVKADLQLSDVQVSLLQGFAAGVPVALLSIPIGRLCDRRNRVRLLSVMALLWTIGCVLTALATDFATLFAARSLVAVGVLCGLPVSLSLAADLSPRERRGRAMMAAAVGRIAGAAIAFAVGGALVAIVPAHGELASWRIIQLGFALASAALVVPFALLREPARAELEGIVNPALREALREIWARRALLAPIFLGQVTVTMADTAAAVWAAPVLAREFGQTPAQFGPWMGLVILLSGLAGSVLGGVLADMGQRGRFRGGMLGVAAVAAVIAIPAGLFPVMSSVGGFATMLTILLVCGAITGLVTATAVTVMVPNELRGLCLAAFVVIGALFGLGLAPSLVALMADWLGGEGQLPIALAVVGVATSAIAAVGFWRAMRAAAVGLPIPA